ncbi:MAG: hypothetical protein Q4D60_09485 [Eubacteriales bacterium]|nr:hypothetical protein [Eubacteriales bacterium]
MMGIERMKIGEEEVVVKKRDMFSFCDRLKKHLSEEMMYLSEKKDDLESKIVQLKVEREKKDKTLFQNMEKTDMRKYFSPLNLSDMKEENKDEKQRELSCQIQNLEQSVEQISMKMEEARMILREMEDMIHDL